jgi:hypothetical protein
LIDDIFGIWSGPKSELEDFIQYLNNNHDTIKFTSDISETEIAFLDTVAYIDNNKIKTKLYKKPTDNKQYLHFNSEHPQHVKEAIPYAQALRYRRIIEDDNIFNAEILKLKNSFLTRNYPVEIIDKAITRVNTLKRLDIIAYKTKTAKKFNATPLILTYSNALTSNHSKNANKFLAKAWRDLTTAYPHLLNLPKPQIVYKKTTSVNTLLVSTLFPPPRWNKPQADHSNNFHTTAPKFDNGNPDPHTNHNPKPLSPTTLQTVPMLTYRCKPCMLTVNKSKTAKCLTCNSITHSNNFHSSTYNKAFSFPQAMDCQTSNIVYLITCTKCSIQYVGETKNSLRTRLNQHRHDVHVNFNTPIGIHFNSLHHTIKNLQIAPIEQLNNCDVNHRRIREAFWQFTLGTTFPSGLNGFPVDKRDMFENFELMNHNDLSLFVCLKTLENSNQDDD